MSETKKDSKSVNVNSSPKRLYHEYNNGDSVCHATVRGIDYLRDPRLNKGMAFTLKERQMLGIHGLLPPVFKTQDEQLQLCLSNTERYKEPLNQYIYLMSLQDRNERLFYKVLSENVEKMMPIVYTPTVGLACQKYGLIYRRPRGLFITIHDAGHVYDVLCNWPEQNVKAIVVTDGERILGLGDLGAYGMGIPVGKLALYTALAGIKPNQTLPIVVDVGTDNQAHLNDEFYIGLRQKRVRGQEYDDFIDEFMQAVVKKYGRHCLIQFEDFGNQNAFRFLEKYKDSYCTFNDDIQGTASVAVAGVLASLRITNKKLADNVFLFQGAGEASIGIANLVAMAMESEGLKREDAVKRIWMVDSKGLITKDRPEGGVTGHKKEFAKDYKNLKNLEDIVKEVKPTVIIGAAAQGGVFTPTLLQDMAKFNERPVIFALSNPTSKAECTAEQAYSNTEGRCVFASGSPFDALTFGGKTFYPGQGNNSYIFPGVALAVVACEINHISDRLFLLAAEALADLVTESHLSEGRVYPPLDTIRDCSIYIATKVAEYAYANKLASYYPEPKDKKEFIISHMYDYNYPDSLPVSYDWPQHVTKHKY
ncbi:NADP-dependent malic enzyme [Chamberlinius hualienensis]